MGMIKEEQKWLISRKIPVVNGAKSYVKERDLLLDVKEYLKVQDLFFRRVESQGKAYSHGSQMQMLASDMIGFPDILICKNGLLYCAELKVRGGHLSMRQAETLVALAASGATAGVVLSPLGLEAMLSELCPTSVLYTTVGEVATWA